MKIILSLKTAAYIGLIWVGAASCALAQSQNAAPDDMSGFLAERGIVARIGEQVSQAGRAVSNTASDLVINAMGFLGVPYKFGGNGAEGGFDCSGFVKAIYQQTIGFVLPRRAAEQAEATQTIDKTELQPGDLVFFNTLRSAFSHVGIYVGDYKFIHSPRSGSMVRLEDMRVNYWSSRFDGARRVAAAPLAPKLLAVQPSVLSSVQPAVLPAPAAAPSAVPTSQSLQLDQR